MMDSFVRRIKHSRTMYLGYMLVATLAISLISPCWGRSSAYRHRTATTGIPYDSMHLFTAMMDPGPLGNVDVLGVVLPSDEENDSAPGGDNHNPSFDPTLDLPDVDTVLQNVEQLQNSLESPLEHVPTHPRQTFIKVIRFEASSNDQLPFSLWTLPSIEDSGRPATTTPTYTTTSLKYRKPKLQPYSKNFQYYKGSAYPPWSYGRPPSPAIRAPMPNTRSNE